MKNTFFENWASWRHSLHIADLLSCESTTKHFSTAEISELIESIEISLGSDINPVDNMQEYALWKLCRAIRMALKKAGEP